MALPTTYLYRDSAGNVREALETDSASTMTLPTISANYRMPFNSNGMAAGVVKAAPGTLYVIQGTNNSGAARFIKIYNKATEATASDAPMYVIEVPGNSRFTENFGGLPISMSAGIAFRITALVDDNDNTPIDIEDIRALNIGYA